MKHKAIKVPLFSREGLRVSLPKVPTLSLSKGRCGKLSVVNNFTPKCRSIIHHSKFFSERVINNGLSTTVISTDQVRREFHSRLIDRSVRAMLYNLCPLRYD